MTIDEKLGDELVGSKLKNQENKKLRQSLIPEKTRSYTRKKSLEFIVTSARANFYIIINKINSAINLIKIMI